MVFWSWWDAEKVERQPPFVCVLYIIPEWGHYDYVTDTASASLPTYFMDTATLFVGSGFGFGISAP